MHRVRFRVLQVIILVSSLTNSLELRQKLNALNHNQEELKAFIVPKIHLSREKREAHGENNFGNVAGGKAIELGDWFVELDSEDNSILAPGLRTEWVNPDESRVLEATENCSFHLGRVRGFEEFSTAVVTLCGESVTGFFSIAGLRYFLEPLDSVAGEHVLYNSPPDGGSMGGRAKRFSQLRTQPKAQTQDTNYWMYNLTGDVIDIDAEGDDSQEIEFGSETGSNVPGENSRKSGPNYGNDTADSDFTDKHHRQDWRWEQIEDEQGYFYDTAWSMNVVQSRQTEISTSPTKWLEIALAVDHTLISFHGRDKVERYVLSLMNIVNAIYQDPSLDANIKLVVTRLLMYEQKKNGIVKLGNAKRSLENVNIWNRKLLASLSSEEPRHDIAVWLTRSDIGGPSGFAPVGGVCDPKRSCSLNRDEGLTSAFIIAHETAHILGLSHDGDKKSGNKCTEEALDGSIMAPMVSATFNKFSWSPCSNKEFKAKTSKWSCLLNAPAGIDYIILNSTLQTNFSMDEQCRMEFGNGYSLCRAFEIIEPCSHLWCGHEDSPLVCKTKKGPPLEGTECGFGKWCIDGYCESVSDKIGQTPIVLNPQDGNWSDWTAWGRCSRTCGIGVQFRSRKCDNPPPSYGGKNCIGENEQWQICHQKQCPRPPTDLRAEQCKYLPKLIQSQAKQESDLTWLPYESDEDEKKCKLVCINPEKKELHETDENLLDGTPCSYDDPDNICVQGKCHRVGCDGKLQSGLFRNRCGVCGGNDTECSDFDSFRSKILKREISRISILPKMAKELKVNVNVTIPHPYEFPVAIVVKNRRKNKYIITVPNAVIRNKIIEGTKFYYEGSNNTYRVWSKGPLHSETVILVVLPKAEVKNGIVATSKTSYSIRKHHLMPSKRYVWVVGGWGPCSVSCGGGRRQKTTACWDNISDKIVKRSFCSLLQKPKLQNEKCNLYGCNFQWTVGVWEPCSASCGTEGMQSRELYCIPESVLNKTVAITENTVPTDPWKFMVNPVKCSEVKPVSMRPCNRQPCHVYWTAGEWSQCSSSCGTGTQIRTVHCPVSNTKNFTCGQDVPSQKRRCHGGNFDFGCQPRNKKHREDSSIYCSMKLLQKYCKLGGFRRICTKSCDAALKNVM